MHPTGFSKYKKIFAWVAASSLAMALSVSNAYGRQIDWTSAELIYTPGNAAGYTSDCLITGGQQIVLADWQPETGARVINISIGRPVTGPTDASDIPTDTAQTGGEDTQSTLPADTTEPEETTAPVETTLPEETTDPTETTAPAETAAPTEVSEPVETTIPTETEADATETPVPQTEEDAAEDTTTPTEAVNAASEEAEETTAPTEEATEGTEETAETTIATEETTEPTASTEETTESTGQTTEETEATEESPEETEATEPEETWPLDEVTVTLDEIAAEHVTLDVQVYEERIQVTLTLAEDAPGLQEAADIAVHVQWQGLEGTFTMKLLPYGPVTMEVTDETDDAQGVQEELLHFSQNGEPLYMVRWSADAENYVLLYESSELAVTGGERIYLDFSAALARDPETVITLDYLDQQLNLNYQELPEMIPLVLKLADLPYTIQMNTAWADTQLELKPIERLVTDEEGCLVYEEDTALKASVTGEGILLELTDADIYPTAGSYRMAIHWIWNGISTQEQIIYFFVNTN